ncbi:MAG: ABC transporter permease, partial [Thermoanaerobaculia bacterium]|nr:ABC transporter permease [Thermoanaerobaculia bacterium]
LYLTPPSRASQLSLRPEAFVALRERTGAIFENVVGQRLTARTLIGRDAAEQVDALGVTEGWAELLGVRAQLGRTFTADEHADGEASEAVLLADGAWRALFGADPTIVGRQVVLDGESKVVIGVLPRGFAYPYEADFWHPTRADRPSASPWSVNAPARLRPGVTVAQANAALAALAGDLDTALPVNQRELTPIAVPLREVLLDGDDRALTTALVVAALLLALVAANLAALFHARWLAARRELAVRAALGAGSRELVRGLALEGALLGAGGLALGLWLARAAQPWLAPQVPARLAEVGTGLALTPRVVALGAALAIAWFVLAALLPGWRVARRDPFAWLRGDAGAGGARQARRATRLFVGLQVGLALALAASTLALAADLRQRSRRDLGYDPRGVALFSTSLASASYAAPERRLRFAERTLEELAALPGVESAAAVHLFPSGRGSLSAFVEPPGSDGDAGSRLQVQHRLVTPEFAATIGLRLLAGRWLTADDDAAAAPVAVISESVARRFFAAGAAVGGRLVNQRDAARRTFEIVGVVADVHEFQASDAAWYLPLAQHAEASSAALLGFVFRTAPEVAPPTFVALRQLAARVDPEVALFDLVSARELLAETVAAQRDAAAAAAFLALFGLALAALGLFVRVAESVLRRRRELAVRLALGATPARVVRGQVAEGARLAAAGLAVGAGLSLALLRLLARELDAPALAADPLPLAVAVAVTAAAALGAAWLAARRAAGVDPASALRSE